MGGQYGRSTAVGSIDHYRHTDSSYRWRFAANDEDLTWRSCSVTDSTTIPEPALWRSIRLRWVRLDQGHREDLASVVTSRSRRTRETYGKIWVRITPP